MCVVGAPRNTSACCRYDPYGRNLTLEEYDQKGMRDARRAAIEKAQSAKTWGLVLGTLGRQGNPAVADKLEALLQARGLEHSVILMSEVSPESLQLMPAIDAWVQVACPRCAAPRVALPTQLLSLSVIRRLAAACHGCVCGVAQGMLLILCTFLAGSLTRWPAR